MKINIGPVSLKKINSDQHNEIDGYEDDKFTYKSEDRAGFYIASVNVDIRHKFLHESDSSIEQALITRVPLGDINETFEAISVRAKAQIVSDLRELITSLE